MTTYKELLAQKQALDAQIAQARKAEAGAALELIQAKIQEFGFTAQEVFPYKTKKAQALAKYHNPSTGQTWTGRAKPPKWIVGQDRAQFEIR
ncbi:MAG TPA: H-NS histone family protein [Burkholderiaceae bacterium]|nr:H-NS histone family protein [Burkholderiaceae bacterium]